MILSVMRPTSVHRVSGVIPGFAGLGIRHCQELQSRLWMLLGSHVAVSVAWASSYSSDSTLALELPHATGASPKKQNERRKEGSRKEGRKNE